MRFWGAVVETVQLCKQGVKKEAKERTTAKELDNKIGGWVEWGLGRKRRCSCEVARDTGAEANTRSSAEFLSKYALDQPSSGGRPSRPNWLPASELSQNFSESRPRSLDGAQQSTVWGLGELATLHENMMRPASVMTFDDSTAWGLGHEPYVDRDGRPSASIISGQQSTVWGLGDAQREEDNDRHSIGPMNSDASATTSCIAMGEMEVLEGYDIDDDDDDDDDDDGDDDDENLSLYGKKDRPEHWPLPLETLTLDRGKARTLDGHRDLRRIGALGLKGMG